MTRAARAIERSGELSGTLPVATGDEIGTLSLTFNRRLHRLREAQQQLVRHERLTAIGQVAADGDHFGNACDGDFNNLHPVVNAFDLGQMRQALGKAVTDTTCPCDDGTLACSCAEFDLNNLHPVINAFDLGIFRGLLGKPPGPSAW
jgi:hypothetical protein